MPGKNTFHPRLAIGADHRGVTLKHYLQRELRRERYRLVDVGTNSKRSVDYPDIARAVGEAILAGRADLGLLVCGSGVGAAVAANKMHGIRAGLCHDVYSAHQSREHDDVNVLCLGSLVVGERLARDILEAWLAARFTGEARHRRRLRKIAQMEEENADKTLRGARQ